MSDPGDARTVLAGGIMLGAPIPTQPDPSKIIGVFRCGPREPEPELPPIPPAGFYWAKLATISDSDWTVVEVIDDDGARRVASIGWERRATVAEWGPALYPPGSGVALVPTPVPTPPANAHPLLHVMANAIDGIDRDIARLNAKRAAVLAELTAKMETPR